MFLTEFDIDQITFNFLHYQDIAFMLLQMCICVIF